MDFLNGCEWRVYDVCIEHLQLSLNHYETYHQVRCIVRDHGMPFTEHVQLFFIESCTCVTTLSSHLPDTLSVCEPSPPPSYPAMPLPQFVLLLFGYVDFFNIYLSRTRNIEIRNSYFFDFFCSITSLLKTTFVKRVLVFTKSSFLSCYFFWQCFNRVLQSSSGELKTATLADFKINLQ